MIFIYICRIIKVVFNKAVVMSTSVKTIRFIVTICIVTLILSYIVSLNIENSFFNLKTTWLSNSFLFALFSGAFASLIVILVCEIQRYYLLKTETERMIFNQFLALYMQVTIIHYNAKRAFDDAENPVAINLFESPSNTGKSILNIICSIDYSPLINNKVTRLLSSFKRNGVPKIGEFLNNMTFFKIALSCDKIDQIKKNLQELVTPNSPTTHTVLKKIKKDSNSILTYLEVALGTIDKECNNRFNWEEDKKKIIRVEGEFVQADIEIYLNHPDLQFEYSNEK